MNSVKRQELANKLYNDSQFLALTSNRDRVHYVLQHVMSYEQFRAEAKANLELARQKCAKSLSVANSYKTMAEAFQKQASSAQTQSATLLQSALESYGKVNILWQMNFFQTSAFARPFCTLRPVKWNFCANCLLANRRFTFKRPNLKRHCTRSIWPSIYWKMLKARQMWST